MTWEMVQLARQVNEMCDQFLSGGEGKGEDGENTSRKDSKSCDAQKISLKCINSTCIAAFLSTRPDIERVYCTSRTSAHKEQRRAKQRTEIFATPLI